MSDIDEAERLLKAAVHSFLSAAKENLRSGTKPRESIEAVEQVAKLMRYFAGALAYENKKCTGPGNVCRLASFVLKPGACSMISYFKDDIELGGLLLGRDINSACKAARERQDQRREKQAQRQARSPLRRGRGKASDESDDIEQDKESSSEAMAVLNQHQGDSWMHD